LIEGVVKTEENTNDFFGSIVSAMNRVQDNERQMLADINHEKDIAAQVMTTFESIHKITQGVFDNSRVILNESNDIGENIQRLATISNDVKDSSLSIVFRAANADELAANSMDILKQNIDSITGIIEKLAQFKTQ
jgi:methyl-accepting chemotaxis protein